MVKRGTTLGMSDQYLVEVKFWIMGYWVERVWAGVKKVVNVGEFDRKY